MTGVHLFDSSPGITRSPQYREQLLRRRTALGLDHRDEMWEGVLHVVPAPSGPLQILSGDLIEQLRPRARARGLVVAPESGLYDPADPDNRWRVPDVVAAQPEHWMERGVEGPAALVIEILSPRDESFAKLPFSAEMAVAEVLIIQPSDMTFWLHRLDGGEYRTVPDGWLESVAAHVARSEGSAGPVLRFSWADGSTADIRPWMPGHHARPGS